MAENSGDKRVAITERKLVPVGIKRGISSFPPFIDDSLREEATIVFPRCRKSLAREINLQVGESCGFCRCLHRGILVLRWSLNVEYNVTQRT